MLTVSFIQYKIVGWTTSALLKTERRDSSSFFSFEILRSEHLSIYVRGNLENIQNIIDITINTIVISIVYININTDIDTLFIIDININGIINKTSLNCTNIFNNQSHIIYVSGNEWVADWEGNPFCWSDLGDQKSRDSFVWDRIGHCCCPDERQNVNKFLQTLSKYVTKRFWARTFWLALALFTSAVNKTYKHRCRQIF